MLDPRGRIRTWNAGAERLSQYSSEEVLGRSCDMFLPHDDVTRARELLEHAAREGRYEDRGWHVRKDGTQFWAEIVITAIRGRGHELEGFAKVVRSAAPPSGRAPVRAAVDRDDRDAVVG